MDTDQIIKKLMENVSPIYNSDTFREKIDNMDPEIKMSLEKYLSDGIFDDLNVGGYSVEVLMKEHGMNLAAAYFTLDWIKRDPVNAIASLQKGHDVVAA